VDAVSPTPSIVSAPWRSTLGRVLRLLGIPVSDDDARRLTATLIADGSRDALTAAEQFTKGVERDLYAIGLTSAERTVKRACPGVLAAGVRGRE